MALNTQTLILAFTILTRTTTLTNANIQIHEIRSTRELLTLRMGDTYIQQGNLKIIHVIELDQFQNMIHKLEKIAIIHEKDNKFKELLIYKINHSKQLYDRLKPVYRSKRSIDWIGSGIKWITGNADASDIKNINDLMKNNDKQVIINQEFQNRLNDLTALTKTIIMGGIKQEMYDLSEIMQIMFHIDVINRQLENIEEALLMCKLGIVARNLFNSDETHFILQKLQLQGIHVANKEEALELLSAFAYNINNEIYYVVSIPQLRNQTYSNWLLRPLTKNGKKIRPESTNVLTSNETFYAMTKPCIKVNTVQICKLNELKDISASTCIPRIIQNLNASCIYEEAMDEDQVELLEPGNMLIQSKHGTTQINSTCGIDQQTLHGNYLLLFDNCSVTINKSDTFANHVLHSRRIPVVLPSIESHINQQHLLLNQWTLQKMNIHNIKRLTELQTAKETHVYVIYSGMSLLTFILMALILTCYCSKPALPQISQPTAPSTTVVLESGRFQLTEGAVNNSSTNNV